MEKQTPNTGKKVFIAGPYIGELGWEVFDWQPMVRAAWMQSGAERCIVYAGAGRTRLYPFAHDIRTLADIPEHESECLGWHNLQEYKTEVEELIQRMYASVQEEKPQQISGLTLANVGNLATPHYAQGRPDCLRLSDDIVDERLDELVGDPDKSKIILCIRDRGMSDYRNMDSDAWEELVEALNENYTVILTGQTKQDACCGIVSDNIIDLLNQTSIDDMIYLFSKHCDLAVGGSTGTLHLASRCATPHLVWGGESNTKRYAECNWFAAPHKVYTWGWQPDIEQVAVAIEQYLDKGVWL